MDVSAGPRREEGLLPHLPALGADSAENALPLAIDIHQPVFERCSTTAGAARAGALRTCPGPICILLARRYHVRGKMQAAVVPLLVILTLGPATIAAARLVCLGLLVRAKSIPCSLRVVVFEEALQRPGLAFCALLSLAGGAWSATLRGKKAYCVLVLLRPGPR